MDVHAFGVYKRWFQNMEEITRQSIAELQGKKECMSARVN